MKSIRAHVNSIIKGDEGQGMAEYGLILTLVAVACIAGFTLLGGNISTFMTNLAGIL